VDGDNKLKPREVDDDRLERRWWRWGRGRWWLALAFPHAFLGDLGLGYALGPVDVLNALPLNLTLPAMAAAMPIVVVGMEEDGFVEEKKVVVGLLKRAKALEVETPALMKAHG
jgi:hypothetical protein